MKKIFCDMDEDDWIKVVYPEDTEKPEDIVIEVKSTDNGCIRLSPDKIRKLRKQLKKALRKIEGEGEVEVPADFPEWFQEGKKVVITGNSNSHNFPMGEVVIVGSVLGDSGTSKRCDYLDGHDYWYVLPSDCKPYKDEWKEGDKVYLIHGDHDERCAIRPPYVCSIDLSSPVTLIKKTDKDRWQVSYKAENGGDCKGYASEHSFGKRAD